MVGEPGVDESGNGGGRGPRPGGGHEVILELAQRRIKAVGDGGFEETAEAVDRVEFRTVGRQRPQIGRQAAIVRGQVETGLIGDDDMQRFGVGVGDLAQKDPSA